MDGSFLNLLPMCMPLVSSLASLSSPKFVAHDTYLLYHSVYAAAKCGILKLCTSCGGARPVSVGCC